MPNKADDEEKQEEENKLFLLPTLYKKNSESNKFALVGGELAAFLLPIAPDGDGSPYKRTRGV